MLCKDLTEKVVEMKKTRGCKSKSHWIKRARCGAPGKAVAKRVHYLNVLTLDLGTKIFFQTSPVNLISFRKKLEYGGR